MTNITSEVQADIRGQIQSQLQTADDELLPCFYAVTGSHQYGTDTTDSDIDVKGFHCADGSQYMLFDPPTSQRKFETSLQPSNTTIEVTSYELRKFGEMLLQCDFSIIEVICGDNEVYSHDPQLLQGIEEILTKTLPAELPVRYLGMADSIYEREVVDSTPTTSAELKPYVYALRGCLAAEYVQAHDKVEPRLRPLAEHILTDQRQKQVAKFATAIQADRLPDQPVLDDIKEIIEEKLEVLEATPFVEVQRIEYKTALAEWMLEVRTQTNTR